MYALIDSNNFFVSCERLFRPGLTHQPVIVLSSNDGCTVSRSNEAKALGIKMGEPIFKLRQRFDVISGNTPRQVSARGQLGRLPRLVSFSANFNLYGDISERIATLVSSITPNIELYSIDESFLDLTELGIEDHRAWGIAIRESILRNVGIPVSVGIARTKTLCKIANHWAKQHAETGGVYCFTQGPRDPQSSLYTQSLPTAEGGTLLRTPVQDVWGVGWRLAPRLRAEGIVSALDLSQMSPKRAQQLMGIHGRHMVYELNGINCLPLQTHTKPQQAISRGRQFGRDSSDTNTIEAAVASLATCAAQELRREHLLATQATVILQTNRYKPGYHQVTHTVHFYTPTADIGTICNQLVRTLERNQLRNKPRTDMQRSVIFRGIAYHKAEVVLHDLVPEQSLQTDLLGVVNLSAHHLSQQRMQALDAINAKHGTGTVKVAAEKLDDSWRPKSAMRSPSYTSSWGELPVAQAKPLRSSYNKIA